MELLATTWKNFEAEIAVLSMVRVTNIIVSHLGYSIEGNEKILLCEYMPLGALSQNLFWTKEICLEKVLIQNKVKYAIVILKSHIESLF